MASIRIFGGGQFGGLTSQTSISKLSTIFDNHQSVAHSQNAEIIRFLFYYDIIRTLFIMTHIARLKSKKWCNPYNHPKKYND